MNTTNPAELERTFAKSGGKNSEFFMIKDEGIYRGFNFVWQVMFQSNPKAIRKLFRKNFYIRMNDFRDDGSGALKWENHRDVYFEIIRRNIVDLLKKDIYLDVDGHSGIINCYSGAIHFVCMGWFKDAYVKCYNQDNGIQDEGCFITTAVCENFGKSDDCYELTAFRNFRDKWLTLQTDGKFLIEEYYNVAPKIVEKINSLTNSTEIYKNIWSNYLQSCLKSIEVGDNLKCKKIYIDMVNTLKEKFLK